MLGNPLLGTASVSWDFTAESGLAVGFYKTATYDVSSLNIALPSQILVTQQFTETDGTSARNGVILYSDPIIGSSPNTVYLKSTSTAEDLHTFSGNPGQFGYSIEVVPEPTPFAGAAVLLGFAVWHWRCRPNRA